MTAQVISRKVKKFLNDNKVKNKISTHCDVMTITILSNCTLEILEAVKAMENVTSTGSVYDDTQRFHGIMFQFNYKIELTDAQKSSALEIINFHCEEILKNNRLFCAHVKPKLIAELGAVGNVAHFAFINGRLK